MTVPKGNLLNKLQIVDEEVNNLIQRYKINDLELNREEKKKNKFLVKKDNTLKSLKEVEFFLCNWKRVAKGIKLYKILK